MTANQAASAATASLQKILHALRMMLTMTLATGLLAALVSPAAWSRTVLDLDARHQPVLLQDWGDYWIDPGGPPPPPPDADCPVGRDTDQLPFAV